MTETIACFLPGRAKDLSAPMYAFFEVGTQFLNIKSTKLTIHMLRLQPTASSSRYASSW